MKIKGKIMICPLMYQMKPGEERFLSEDAIVILEKEVFIKTNKSVSPIKDDVYVIPIKRTGKEKSDFEIDFYIASYFFTDSLDKEEKELLIKNPWTIGPFPIETEIHDPLNYREQSYPRMDFEELMETFVDTNKLLMEIPHDKNSKADKKKLRECIKKILDTYNISQLKEVKREFEELSDEENEDGKLINFCADTHLVTFIENKIDLLSENNFESLSIEDLEEKKRKAIRKSDFEQADKIQKIINSRNTIESGGSSGFFFNRKKFHEG